MPFKSEAQRKFLFASHPKVAEEFAAHTPPNAALPEYAKPRSRRKGSKRGEARLNRSGSLR